MVTELRGAGFDSLVGLLDTHVQSGAVMLKQWSSRTNGRFELTYPEVYRSTQRVSSFLQEHGVEPHDRIMLWGANSPQWVISYFGSLRAGAAVVPFDVNREAGFLNKVVEATKPRFIIAGEDQRKFLPISGIPVLDMEQIAKISGADNFQAKPVGSLDDAAEIVFTSGTTGNPKGVVLSHGNILSNVDATLKVVPFKDHYRMLSVLPLSHMFETSVGLLIPVSAGSGVVYVDTLQPNSILSGIRDEGITCMAVAPQVLQLFQKGIEQQVVKAGKKGQFDLMASLSPIFPHSVRRRMFRSLHERMGGKFEFFVSGGGRLDPKVADFWERLGIKVIQGYGMTEASPVVSSQSMLERNHDYVGRPLPGIEVNLADDGEILVRGPNIMKGYWNNQSATEEALKDGWYHTGDLGVLDKGRLKLVGRKGNMIVLSNGLNVYPEDVEDILAQQGIREAVVFKKESNGKEELHAVLLLADPNEDPKILIQSANKRLSAHQRVQGWTVWERDDFPRTHTLKAKRQDIIKEIE